MAIATGTAILIGAGIAAGTQVAGSTIASKANKKAAETQAGAAGQALEEERRQYDTSRADLERTYQQQRADEAPYLALGGGAVGALTHGLGLTPTPPKTVAAPTMTSPGAPVPVQTAAQRRAPGEVAGVPQGALGMFAGGPQTNSGPSGGIPMRAPNGQVTRVAPDQVAHYTQLGAKVV